MEETKPTEAPLSSAPLHPKYCDKCGAKLHVLLFMGVQPEGYVCIQCKVFFGVDGKPLAKVI